LFFLILSTALLVLGGCAKQNETTIASSQTSDQNLSSISSEPTTSLTAMTTTSVPTEDVSKYIIVDASDFIDVVFNTVIQDRETLEQYTTDILIATVIKTDPPMDSEYGLGNRFTTIRIDRVFRSADTINVKDELLVGEMYYSQPVKDDPNHFNIGTLDRSVPLMKGHQYLLFLKKNETGHYSIVNFYMGKFPITEKTLSHRFTNLNDSDMEFPVDLQSDSLRELLWKLAGQAYDKYLAN
jgi:hypothetical protein